MKLVSSLPSQRGSFPGSPAEGQGSGVPLMIREMEERGVAPGRIEIEGRGERDPIVMNDTEEHRQMNRRVEIVLL